MCEERAGQAQLEAMQRTLHEQEALLTDRVRVGGGGGGGDTHCCVQSCTAALSECLCN